MAIDLLYGLLPEHILLGLVLVLMLLEISGAGRRQGAIFFALFMAAACFVLFVQVGQGYAARIVPGEIHVDRFALVAKAVILLSAFFLGLCYLSVGTFKSWILLASSLLGAMVMMDSAGFISLFLGIEMLSLPAFALIVHGHGGTASSEGAFKYLLLSSVATALMLFGISFSYGSTGSLAIAPFAASFLGGGAHNLAAGMLVLSGLFLKAAVFPFHGWAPDAYSSARIHVTAFLASVVKGAVILTLVRVFASVPLNAAAVAAIVVLSLLSIFYGNITAIRQTSFKRLLAYSSIAHAGYMIFALIDTTGGRAVDLLVYVAIYALMTVLACASFSAISAGEQDDLRSLEGAFSTHPVASLLLAFAMLSFAGIPPLPGFFAKLFVFRSVIASGYLVPAVVAFAGSFIGITFYLGIVSRLFNVAPGERSALSQPLASPPRTQPL
jgi:NADH-quinone oxidoreductase subunit N